MANFPFDLNQPLASDDSGSPPPNDNSEVSNLGDQNPEEREHFSIRGYVAGVRERHPEQCNPFSNMNHGGSSMDATNYELARALMQNHELNYLQCENNITTLRLGSSSVIVSNETQKTTIDAEIEYAFMILTEMLFKRMVEMEASKEQNNNNIELIEDNRDCNPSSTIESVVVDDDRKGKRKAYFEDDHEQASLVTEFEFRILLRGSSSRAITQGTADDEGAIVVRAKGVKRVGDAATKSFHHHLHQRIQNPGGIVIGSPRDQRVIREEAEVVLADDIRTEGGAGNFEGSGSHSDSVKKVLLPDLNEVLVESEGDDKADEYKALVEDKDDNKDKAADENEASTEDDDDDYFSKDCRKTPKTRLMSEILGIKPNETKLTYRKNTLSLGFRSTNPQPQLSVNQSGNKPKRASFYRDNKEAKTMELKGSNNNVTKKPRTFRAVRICESESESETESDSEYEAFAKKRCRSSLGKKKPGKKRNHKRAKSVQGDKKMMPKRSSSYKKEKSSDKRKTTNDAAAHDVNDRNNNAALMAKKKGKMVQTGKGSHSDSPISVKNHVSRECSSTGKENEDMQECTENVVRVQSGFGGNRERRTVSKTNSKGKRLWIPEGEEEGS